MIQISIGEWKRTPIDYPRVDKIDEHDVQYIELNRGCKRGCAFCHANPDYQVYDVPEIKRNIVQIIGEGLLYDPEIKQKITELGNKRVNGKVVYYGLSQGFDFRLFDNEIAEIFLKNRIGIINNKGRWYKGIRFAWDGGLNHEQLTKQTIDILIEVGYKKKQIQVFVLSLWKFPYELCELKRRLLYEMGVKIDDCTWDTTKKNCRAEIKNGVWTNQFWKVEDYIKFRRDCRKHNQLINHDGYDPEWKLKR